MTLALEKSLCFYMIWYRLCITYFYEWSLSSPPHENRCPFLTLGYRFLFQVGYESPHPHMRVPGLPASLQSAASGKPWVSSVSACYRSSLHLFTINCPQVLLKFQLQHKEEKMNNERCWRGKNRKIKKIVWRLQIFVRSMYNAIAPLWTSTICVMH